MRRQIEPNPPSRNTREFLPKQKPVKFVPMSPEEFRKQRFRRIAKWVIPIVVAAALLLIILLRSSVPAAARNDFLEAKRLYDSGKVAEALAPLDRSISQEANLMDAYELRASVYRWLNRPKEALSDISRVIELRPDLIDNYKVRGQIYRDLADYENAIRDYTHIIQTNASAFAYSGRGICYRDSGKLPKAVEDFTKAIQMEPSVEHYQQRGEVYETLGEHRKAIDDFTHVIDLRPEVPFTYRSRAFAREAIGDKAGAQADRAKAKAIEEPAGKGSSKTP